MDIISSNGMTLLYGLKTHQRYRQMVLTKWRFVNELKEIRTALYRISKGRWRMSEWKPFDFDDGELPELDRPYHITYGSDAELNSPVYRTHRDKPYGIAYLQRQEGAEWKDVSWPNACWIVKNCKWRYADNTAATTQAANPALDTP